jgi:hypothetical protein
MIETRTAVLDPYARAIAMSHRRRIKQIISLKERLALFAKKVRAKALRLPRSAERDSLLKKASRADTAAHLEEWANSPGLQPPK